MATRVRSFLKDAWPFLGAVYLLYLALQPPPGRYVGIGGLLIVTPLLVGWTVGRLFGIGPWAQKADGNAPDETVNALDKDGNAPDETVNGPNEDMNGSNED